MNDERPYLKVEVLGRILLGLLDSGASRTVVGTIGYEQLKALNLELLPSSVNSCSVANGEECVVTGSFNVPFRLQDKVKVINVLVMPSLPHSLILGADFWRRMGVVPDIRRGHWTFTDTPEHQIASLTTTERLTTDQTEHLQRTLKEIFEQMPEGLGRTPLVEHVVRLKKGIEPIKQRFYPMSPAIQKIVHQELEEMLKLGVVRPSRSAWSSPIVMARKKDGTYRFCVDYRKVNQSTERDAYPLPFVSNTLDKLRDAKFLTSLDIKSAYWQVPVEESSRAATAFTVPGRGLFEFCRMPFGLHNSPATWQRLIDNVLGYDLEPYVFVYLDDIVIVTNDFSKHLEVLQEVFKRLGSAGLTVSRKKCQFCRPQLKYLGYVVDGSGLHVDPEKVAAIINLPPPVNVKEIRAVLGTCGWYRRFIPNFASIVAPITNLLRKKQKFEWTPTCAAAFDKIKECLVSAPIISCPDFNRPFCVQTDASDYGLGAVLTQDGEDGEQVVSYISRSLSTSERKFSTTEKECLGVVWAIEKFRPYIEATHFTVITDHFALKWLNTLKDPSGRLARWSVRLQQYSFDVIHRRGKDHVVPDLLSRSVPVIDVIEIPPPENPPVLDRWYRKMIRMVTQSPLRFPLWRVENHRLYKRVNGNYPELREPGESWKKVIPKEDRKDLLRENHDSTTGGHAGVYKTYERLKSRYYWPQMRADVARHVRSCQTCLRHKPEQRRPIGFMGTRTTPTRPWQTISIDLCGPLPRSTQGFCHILVVSDCFSKYVLLFPLRTATAVAVVKCLEDHVFLVYGCPQHVICDNGVQFRSNQFNNLCEKYSVNIIHTPAYSPQGNPVERVNRVLKTMLASYVADNHRKWEQLLPKVGCAIRTSVHETTGVTPFFVNFGREHVISGTQYQPGPEGHETKVNDQRDFEPLFADVRARLIAAHRKSKQRYDLRRRFVEYEVGSMVYRRNFALSNADKFITAKLAPKFLGPFVVKRKISSVVYELADEHGNDKGIWHVKDIKQHPPDVVEVVDQTDFRDRQANGRY